MCDIKTNISILKEKSFGLINREGSWCYFLIVCKGRIPGPVAGGSLRQSDLENMDVMLCNGEYNPNERETDQMTGYSNMVDRDDSGEVGSVRGNSSQENEIRDMPENRENGDFSRDMETLTGDMNLTP